MLAHFRIVNPWAILAALVCLPLASRGDAPQVDFNGAGWLQFGRVEESHTTADHVINDYQHNWLQNSGALIGATVKFDENWDGGLGLGTIDVHLARGKSSNASIWYPFWVPFVSEARVTHSSSLFSGSDKLRLTIGAFGYDYNPDVKNLGLYLMKGYVYPGTLVSAFTGPLGSIAPTTGGMASYQVGGFQNDLILVSETDDKPLYDLSIVDAITLKVASGLEFGAGVNFYRAIPQSKRLTSPGKDCNASTELGFYSTGCFSVDSVGADASGAPILDTTTGSLAGTKLMARFRWDPKEVFGLASGFGKNDLVLYGEAAVLGVKNFSKYYNDIKRRIPVMVGFDFPTHRLLDNLSLEVEYYASKNSSDNLGAQFGSWVPEVDNTVNNARDDWKWSLNIDKMLGNHMKWSTQFANDHLRLGGYHNYLTGVEATTTPKDWYWTTKAVYFF